MAHHGRYAYRFISGVVSVFLFAIGATKKFQMTTIGWLIAAGAVAYNASCRGETFFALAGKPVRRNTGRVLQ